MAWTLTHLMHRLLFLRLKSVQEKLKRFTLYYVVLPTKSQLQSSSDVLVNKTQSDHMNYEPGYGVFAMHESGAHCRNTEIFISIPYKKKGGEGRLGFPDL